MSPEAQHEAISREVGYYLIHDEETDSVSLRHPTLTTLYPWHRTHHEQFAWEDGPDFLSDLNACHEMEKTLDGVTAFAYFRTLATVCRYPVIATAGERSESFLRTIGKWDDTK